MWQGGRREQLNEPLARTFTSPVRMAGPVVWQRQRSAMRLAGEQLDLRGWLLELAELAPQRAAHEVWRVAVSALES